MNGFSLRSTAERGTACLRGVRAVRASGLDIFGYPSVIRLIHGHCVVVGDYVGNDCPAQPSEIVTSVFIPTADVRNPFGFVARDGLIGRMDC
jgi:hypothetical protein